MLPLRLIAPIVFFALVHVALFQTFRLLFLPRPEHARLRRLLAAAMTFAALFLPLHFLLTRDGYQWPKLARWLLVYPLLSWNLGAVFLLLVLGSAASIARRLPQPRGLAPTPTPTPTQTQTPTPTQTPTQTQAPTKPSLVLTEPRRIFLARSATLVLGGAALAGVAGWETVESDPEITRHDIHLKGLHPDLDGLTLLQLSDIHSGGIITEERMRAFAAQAEGLGADVIVFTGDQLDSSAAHAAPFSRAFRDLHGKLGTFAILGNHDYFAGLRPAMRAVGDAGQTLLRNSGTRISRGQGTLWLGGTDDPSSGEVDPKRAMHGAAPEEAKIMLAHRPSEFPRCAAVGAQLVLSGHTHGGQFALSPTWSAARLLGPYTMGAFEKDGAQLYVHRGMGVVSAAPMRLGSRPELALLTLRRV